MLDSCGGTIIVVLLLLLHHILSSHFQLMFLINSECKAAGQRLCWKWTWKCPDSSYYYCTTTNTNTTTTTTTMIQQEDFCSVNDRTRNNGEKFIVKRFKNINSSTFLPHQDNNHLESPTKWYSKQQNSEHIQEPPRPTLWTESHKCVTHLLTITFINKCNTQTNVLWYKEKKIKMIIILIHKNNNNKKNN